MDQSSLTAPMPRDRAVSFGWRMRRAVQWPLQLVLVLMADRLNMFVARGMHRSDGINAGQFLRAPLWSIATDYVRNATLELLCREIRQQEISGAVGELGVYKGDFALLMHANLPDRRIHLFDTFEGFDDRDRSADASKHYVAKFHDFSDTSAARVAGRFPNRAEVALHPGWFPESAHAAADERFALVSIDADLYQPVLAGLRWFWPRLNPGGCILVHDYNNASFKGAKEAVREFLRTEPGTSCVPIPDWGGTGVIAKPIV